MNRSLHVFAGLVIGMLSLYVALSGVPRSALATHAIPVVDPVKGQPAPGMSFVCFQLLATELGLSPQSLAASGMVSSAESVLTTLGEQQAICTVLMTARSALTEATNAHTAAVAALSVNPADANAQNSFESSAVQIAQIQNDIASMVATLRQSVFNGVPQGDVAQLDAWKASLAFEVEPAMRVVVRTEAEWRAIAVALIAERRATRLEKPLHSETTTLLATIRGEPAVIQAQADLDASIAESTTLFAQHAGTMPPS